MDIEAVVARHLKAKLGCNAYLEVPKNAPETFITVEQTGGGGNMLERVQFDIDCFAGRNQRKAAKALATSVCAAIPNLDEETNLFHPKVENTYRMNDPDSGRSRYVVQASVYVCE